jgi:hypothetical protein
MARQLSVVAVWPNVLSLARGQENRRSFNFDAKITDRLGMKMCKSSPFLSYTLAVTSILSLTSWIVGCSPSDSSSGTSASTSAALFATGDLIVSNGGSDAVLVLDADGEFKNVLYEVDNTTETVTGLSYLSTTGEILVAVDGVDRIVAVDSTGVARDFIINAQVNGTMRGLTQLASGGDVLIVETNNIERVDVLGNRITTGGWPLSLQTGGQGISPRAAGGFVHCSNTLDVLRTYNNAGTQQATVSSGIAGTTDAMDCRELSNANIITVWSGTTDTVRIYNAALSSTVASFADQGKLATPAGLTQTADGRILVMDSVFNHIVELTSALVFSRIIGDTVLSTPQYIMEVP